MQLATSLPPRVFFFVVVIEVVQKPEASQMSKKTWIDCLSLLLL
jgi:hypothetical protein